MRITGGEFGGRNLRVPKSDSIRPTQDRVREALFNILAPEIAGADFLDLFAGCGAVGLEALSRGAHSVTAVERDRRHIAAIEGNAADLKAPHSRFAAVAADAYRWIASYSGGGFSIAFADPPYALGEERGYAQVLATLAARGVVRPGGLFVAEMTAVQRAEDTPGWELLRDRIYGKTRLCIWRRGSEMDKTAAIRFEKSVHTALWGFEEWLVSAHPSSPSKIVGDGRTLDEALPGFPLLVKRICARDRLSVQVHPNDLTAKSVGGEAKTEMWCVLQGGPIFAGFRSGTTIADVEQAVRGGTLGELLVRFDAKPGECYFIPGGLVHAIGEGTSVYEVQQSSDTTFRLSDWGRVGADGRPRQLHVSEGLAAMDPSLPPPTPSDAVDCPYFSFRKVPAGEIAAKDAWQVVYVPSAGESALLRPGAGYAVQSPAFVTEVRGSWAKGGVE